MGQHRMEQWDYASNQSTLTVDHNKFKQLILVSWDECLRIINSSTKSMNLGGSNDYLKTHTQFINNFSQVVYYLSNFEADSVVSVYEFIHMMELMKRVVSSVREDYTSDMDLTFAFCK